MTSRIGNMRERIVFQQQSRTVDSMGGAAVTWSTVTTVWASVDETSGNETFPTLQIKPKTTVTFMIRYLSTITQAMRISWNSNFYNIQSIINEGNRDKYQKIVATRGVAV
jgi:SPP1 family predicted phage head-tail adaptor